MSERATPRTDALFPPEADDNLGYGSLQPYRDHAHQLERELAEAREDEAAMSRIAAACQCPSKDAEIAILKGQLADARRERDNALSDYQQADADSIRALHERNAERALADRLAGELQNIQGRCSDMSIVLHPDADAKGCVDDCWEWSEQALAAYKAERQEKP